MANLTKASDVRIGKRPYTGIIVYSNVDHIIREYKNRMSNAVLQAAKTIAEGCQDKIQNTYSFKDVHTTDDYVKMRFNVGADIAHVRVIGKQFTAGRMDFKAPQRTEKGYTDIFYSMKERTKFKGFPIKFKHGAIMSTRSGVKTVLEPSWQSAQSAMPFGAAQSFDDIMDRSKETIFETTVRRKTKKGKWVSYKRAHSFNIVRTKSIADIAEQAVPEIMQDVSREVNIEITKPRTEFWKFKKKKRKG